MQIRTILEVIHQKRLLVVCALLLMCSFIFVGTVRAASAQESRDGRLITFHDRGIEKVILTHAATVKAALKSADITLGKNDIVEPRLDSELVATDYAVNIYRARPVVVVDGAVRQKIMTAAQTPQTIAADADISLHSEDKAVIASSRDIITNSAGVTLTITRATQFTLQLYGTPTVAYSHAATVGEMLKQKDIQLAPNDTLSSTKDAPLVPGMTVTLWREGVQTATIEEEVKYPVRTIQDSDQQIGYHAIKTPGIKGKKNVVYEITAKNGRETGRKVIQSVVLEQPAEQVEVIGIKPGPNSLTKAKGAQQFKDSKGVLHRETYYDLPMNVVMGACGGGDYTIRADGAKVDKDGYILVAANLGNYPRCSLVETSMGLGKVYDTGGFAVRHPHGFDLATDWSNGDGR